MKPEIKRQLNNLKEIKPDQKWVLAVRNDILEDEKSFLFNDLEPKFAFGSLALVGMLLAMIVTGVAQDFPEVEMVQNRVNPRIAHTAMRMRNMDEDESDEETMIASLAEGDVSVAEIDFENLSEEEMRELALERTDELLAEIDALEERILRVMAASDGNSGR